MKKVSVFIVLLVTVVACTQEVFEVPVEDNGGGNEIIYSQTPYQLKVPANLPPPPKLPVELTEEGVALGKKLFFDPILSRDGSQSCGSCHAQEYAFTDSGNRFSVGIRGQKGTKNSMALFNLVYFQDFFWDGREPSLQSQALRPIMDHLEMDNTWSNAVASLKADAEYPLLFRKAYNKDIDSTLVANALTQFQLTLLSGNSKYDEYLRNETPLSPKELLGLQIFNSEPRQTSFSPPGGDCFHCHNADGRLFTDLSFSNNGLDANPAPGLSNTTGRSSDIGKFKVPSLRNVEVTRPYMHDGRFETLEEVVEHYNSGVKESPTLDPIMLKSNGIANGLNLTQEEKEALVAFLKTLTDEDFLTNPEYQPDLN